MKKHNNYGIQEFSEVCVILLLERFATSNLKKTWSRNCSRPNRITCTSINEIQLWIIVTHVFHKDQTKGMSRFSHKKHLYSSKLWKHADRRSQTDYFDRKCCKTHAHNVKRACIQLNSIYHFPTYKFALCCRTKRKCNCLLRLICWSLLLSKYCGDKGLHLEFLFTTATFDQFVSWKHWKLKVCWVWPIACIFTLFGCVLSTFPIQR